MVTMSSRHILISGLFLCIFAVIGTSFVAVTEDRTREKIADNEHRVLLRNLYALLPPDKLDNDIASDTRTIPASALLGTESDSLVYRARLREEPVAVIFNSIALNGYSGRIHLLVGVYFDGSLAGVRAVKHAETPGLGDAIDLQKTDWILGFENQSLEKPQANRWKVKHDGGVFDQFTGATITPRAVVEAVKNTLLYYDKNARNLYD